MTKQQHAYSRYSAYCVNAGVKPYSYRYWVREVYKGSEDHEGANWN